MCLAANLPPEELWDGAPSLKPLHSFLMEASDAASPAGPARMPSFMQDTAPLDQALFP